MREPTATSMFAFALAQGIAVAIALLEAQRSANISGAQRVPSWRQVAIDQKRHDASST